jgi:hypothetical protein
MDCSSETARQVASANSSPYLQKIVSKARVLPAAPTKKPQESGGMKSALV